MVGPKAMVVKAKRMVVTKAMRAKKKSEDASDEDGEEREDSYEGGNEGDEDGANDNDGRKSILGPQAITTLREETPSLPVLGGQYAMEEDVSDTIASTRIENVMRETTPNTGGAMEGNTSKYDVKETTVRFVSLMRRVRNDIGAVDDETKNVPHADKESVDDPNGMDIEDNLLLDIPDNAPQKLAPSDNISYNMKEMKEGPHFLDTKCKEDDEWGHHIIWHPGLFEPCVIDGGWHMAIRMGGKWVFRETVLGSRFYEIAKDNFFTRVRQANKDAPNQRISDNSCMNITFSSIALRSTTKNRVRRMEVSYGTQIVFESTMGEKRVVAEGVSVAEHEKAPSTTNVESGEENENEEEADKSHSVINLVDQSGENEETSDKEDVKESGEESQERERDLSEMHDQN
ncbi:hypothetical protein CBR_g55873 [Chara braunii]|uniref:Uncharacterized protein n=1 Tax=Chara braunii TaxID=69332 RepID=A0A388MD98_CHABU|nr:hypothetical protein CBR_g55873 [Chara braunii]|eukprot:GBG92538.1 hypothetical protein CBR_g55873 [Chara braunii]